MIGKRVRLKDPSEVKGTELPVNDLSKATLEDITMDQLKEGVLASAFTEPSVGDRVICILKNSTAEAGTLGKVVYCEEGLIGVHWDENIGGHDLSLIGKGPLCPDGHGELMTEENIFIVRRPGGDKD